MNSTVFDDPESVIHGAIARARVARRRAAAAARWREVRLWVAAAALVLAYLQLHQWMAQ